MDFLSGPAAAWAVLAIHIFGLTSACLARFSEGCSCQRFCQGLFFVSLALVAVSAVVSAGLGPDCWLTSAAILAMMVVAATFQLGESRRAVAW